METIKVINRNDEVLYGRFDGEDFVFEPNKATVLSVEAAKHIFDLGEEDKSNALNHLGLLIPGRTTYKEALAKLDRIEFREGRVVFDDEDSAAAAVAPARKKTGGRPHVAGPGGEQAAGADMDPAAANPA